MATHPDVPEPIFPLIPENITLEQILPAIRNIAVRKRRSYQIPGLEVKSGKKFLMLCDGTNDKMVIDALTIAIEEGGGLLDTVILNGYPGMTEPIDLLDAMFSRNWLPPWVWQAAAEADAVIRNLFILVEQIPGIPSNMQKKFITMYLSRDMCIPQFQNFPVELRDKIDEIAWKSLVYSEKMSLTDLEGTDLRWSITRQIWDKAMERDQARYGKKYHPGHLMAPLPSKDAEGKLVASSITFAGPVPRTTMTIRGGQVVAVEGQGKFVQVLRSSFEEYKTFQSPRLPGPGINWWTSLAFGTFPKARIADSWDKMTGSGRMHAWGAGHHRSGVIHTSVGEGEVSIDRKIVRHVNLYFPTLMADGKKIIDKGHLMALDEPEIIKMAAKYGDPADLLKEDWIPAISGINAV